MLRFWSVRVQVHIKEFLKIEFTYKVVSYVGASACLNLHDAEFYVPRKLRASPLSPITIFLYVNATIIGFKLCLHSRPWFYLWIALCFLVIKSTRDPTSNFLSPGSVQKFAGLS